VQFPRLVPTRLVRKGFRMARYWWLGLLASLAATTVPASAWQTYGYSYGPVFNYDYFAGSIFGHRSNDNVYPYRHMGCPILCIGGYWQDTRKRRPIAIIRGIRILIR
jgi:hypothetical protein